MYLLQCRNTARVDPPSAESEDCLKKIRENQSSHPTDAQWVTDLKAVHCILPEHGPVTSTAADIQQQAHEELERIGYHRGLSRR